MGYETSKKIIIRTLIVILIALIAFAGYIVLVNNSKFKVKISFRYMFDKVESGFKTAEKNPMANEFLNNKVELTSRMVTKLSLSDDVKKSFGTAGSKIENLINNSTIETDIKSDIPNKYIDELLSYTYDNEKISGNIYLDDSQMYLNIPEYFSKYIKVDSKDFDAAQFFKQITSGVKVDELRYLTNIAKNSVLDGTNYSTIKSSKEEIEISEEKIYANKTTLTIDTNFENKVETILLNKILHDNKAKEILYKLVDHTTYPDISYLENAMMNELSRLETVTDNKVIGEYSIYTTGLFSNLVRVEYKSIDGNNAVQYTTYKTSEFDTQICIFENNKLSSQINIKKSDNDNYDIAIKYGSDVSADIRGKISQSLTDISYTIRISAQDDIKGDLRLETSTTTQNIITQKLNLKLNTPESYGTVNITIDSNMKRLDNIIKPDFTNSTNIDMISKNEMNDISKKFENKNPKIITAITDIVSSIFSSMIVY